MHADDGGEAVGRLSRFLLATLAAFVLVFVAGTLLTPPDPFTQLRALGVGLLLAFLAAYWLVYRRGWRRLRRRLGG